MNIFLNEKPVEIENNATLFQVRNKFKPDADILILNGFPTTEDAPVNDSDHISLIRRGELPSPEELESLMAARHTPDIHQKIKKACVGIAGAGGLGSPVAIALGRIGVGKIIIADYDVVEPSNLNRQQYFVDQIGQAKVEALKTNMARINPYVEVTAHQMLITPQNIPSLFSEVDVMVEALDGPDQKAMLIGEFLSQFPDTPLVAASGVAGYGPSNTIITRQAARNLYLVGDGETGARPGEGLMAPRVGVAAHHQANTVLRLILGEKPE